MDYIIADKVVIPEESKVHYVEKLAYLPNSYQANDDMRTISDRKFSKAELGLPEDAFVFACFNNNYKITPTVFDSWLRILSLVQGSVLWLLADNPTAKDNLIKEAFARGIDSSRLVFAERLPISEHLARHDLADLFLDTLPYNAHTTCSDALWAGLPVLTLMGHTFPGRVSASLLSAMGLSELVTHTQEDYEALAVELAMNRQKLADIKVKLAKNRLSTPLFNTPLFTKNIEAAYMKMMERYQADLEPDHIFVT
jgi:predicted O-linked N-acetylglucosamine transferase (SPINDLY family)